MKYKSFEKQSSCRAPILEQLSNHYWNGWAWLQQLNAWCNLVLLLSCDNVLKFDWYYQLSGSGSNSLNSQKLPGHFSYGLGTAHTWRWHCWLTSQRYYYYCSWWILLVASCVTKDTHNVLIHSAIISAALLNRLVIRQNYRYTSEILTIYHIKEGENYHGLVTINVLTFNFRG